MKTISTNILQSNNYWLSETFKEILGDIKEVPEYTGEVKGTILTEETDDSEIMGQVGIMSREECISLLIHLTQKQKNGEEGLLLTNGYSNIIGYVKLDDGRVLTVYALWNSDDEQWYCNGYKPHAWYVGNQFLSRNGETVSLSPEKTLEPSDTLNLSARITNLENELKSLVDKIRKEMLLLNQDKT